MNPFELVGKAFDDVKDTLGHAGVKGIFDDLEEGEEQQFSVQDEGGAWELSLGDGQIIEAVFLHKPDKFESVLGFGTGSSLEVVQSIYGECTSHGEPSDDRLLGAYGAWERYDRDEFSLHVEHEIGSSLIKMVTIMMPKVAP